MLQKIVDLNGPDQFVKYFEIFFMIAGFSIRAIIAIIFSDGPPREDKIMNNLRLHRMNRASKFRHR